MKYVILWMLVIVFNILSSAVWGRNDDWGIGIIFRFLLSLIVGLIITIILIFVNVHVKVTI